MPVGVGFCYGVDDIVERVILIEGVEITGDLLPKRHQHYSPLSKFVCSSHLCRSTRKLWELTKEGVVNHKALALHKPVLA